MATPELYFTSLTHYPNVALFLKYKHWHGNQKQIFKHFGPVKFIHQIFIENIFIIVDFNLKSY